jgi:tRNA (cytidine/uridine-2'-O-)-methyltransferase
VSRPLRRPVFVVIRLVLFQPDIPQNAGAMMRLAACMGISLDLVEPCGFPLDDQRMKRAGMDYLAMLDLVRHTSWTEFRKSPGGRLVLLTTGGNTSHVDFAFRPDDRIVVGRESAGVPAEVHDAADARIRIPMLPGIRSINVAQAAAIAVSEALRQTGQFP